MSPRNLRDARAGALPVHQLKHLDVVADGSHVLTLVPRQARRRVDWWCVVLVVVLLAALFAP